MYIQFIVTLPLVILYNCDFNLVRIVFVQHRRVVRNFHIFIFILNFLIISSVFR
jgi:hypothetical protein